MSRTYRIAVLGAKKVGKTCLINRLLRKGLPGKYNPTIETLFRYETRSCDENVIKLEILDTAGDFEFPDMLKMAIRSCHAFVLVFDVSDPKRTFGEVETLRQLIFEENRTESIPIIVIGNKADIVSKQDDVDNKITDAIVSIDWGCSFITTSARCDENIDDVYAAVCKGLQIKVSDVKIKNEESRSKIVKTKKMSSIRRKFSFKSL